MTSSLFNISGKVAVVTGASGGIGLALVRGLADAGALVVGADKRDPIGFPEKNVRFLKTDVSREADVEALVEKACREFGRIDIMIANAAIGGGARAEDETPHGWDEVLSVNAKGSFLCARAAARKMKDQGGGAIIQIASVLSFIGYPTAVAYTASKGAVAQMTRTLAAEWARFNIRVNAIAPGFIRTPMNEAILKSDEYLRPIIAKIPLGRAGEPEEIVGTVIYLASDASRFVTGSVIVVDGGELASGGYTEGVMPYIYNLL
jgi:NAD(P)-dependent dehydrogenase (short-subunit alcohol dehydrogenase family)